MTRRQRYSAFEIGDAAETTIEVTEAHFAAAATLFDDRHPIHHDDAYAIERGHLGRILPGAMISGIASSCLATMLSQCGLALLEARYRYRAPVFLGDRITARCEIVGKEDKPHRDGGLVFLELAARNQDGVLILEGSAVDLASDVAPAA